MTPPPIDRRWFAAAIAVVVAGAVSGSAIGTAPMLDRSDSSIPAASPRTEIGAFAFDRDQAPPDHYPLVTPTGTIPVAQLALHGRLRNARHGWWEEPAHVPLEAHYPDQLEEAEIEHLAEWTPPRDPRRSSEQPMARATVAIHRGRTIASDRPPSAPPAARAEAFPSVTPPEIPAVPSGTRLRSSGMD